MQDNVAWYNGRWCKVRDLKISVLDLGFTHSDATYDVMAFINNNGRNILNHIDRFVASCEYSRFDLLYTPKELTDIVTECHARSGWAHSLIWLTVTRGVSLVGDRNLESCVPNLMCYTREYRWNGSNNMALWLAQQRRIPDDIVNQKYKNFAWQDLTMAQWEAIDHGFDSAILLSQDGYLTEGPGFNVAIIKDGKVLAPATNCLPGVSMQLIKNLCDTDGIPFEFTDIDEPMLLDCDDMFTTSTAGTLTPVYNFNGRYLPASKVRMRLLYLLMKNKIHTKG